MRNIYIVTATQVVISENHPEGLWSVKPNYPKTYDTLSYDTEEKAYAAAESEYRALESAMLVDTNPNRAMQAITLEFANGRSILHRCVGAFPVPQPEEEPQEEPQEEPAE